MTKKTLTCDTLSIDMSRFSQQSIDYKSPHHDMAVTKLNDWLLGDAVNVTENRAAMHMALRGQQNDPWPAQFIDPVLETRQNIKEFIQNCKARTIVHIGIGGSDFGPRLIVDALKHNHTPLRDIYFLSTLTPQEIKATIEHVDLNDTVFVIASKSLGTDETLFILDLLQNHYNVNNDHIVAVTASPEKAQKYNIAPNNIFPLWDWVGGRFSLWSSVGISIGLVYGFEIFQSLLDGARSTDLILYEDKDQSAMWRVASLLKAQRDLYKRYGLALLPYDSRLTLLPAYAQQLIMESNGKNKAPETAPIIFGQTGTEFQHSFGQYLHQGPDITTSCFITIDERYKDNWMNDARQRLNVNANAQADTLWQGRDHDDTHRHLDGQRPALMISMPMLNAYNMGALLAFFEHVTVCDAFLSDINPFDQWGVEAGKIMAKERFEQSSSS